MRNLKNYGINTYKNRGPVPLLEKITHAYLSGDESMLGDNDRNILKRWKVVRMLEFQHRPCVGHSEIVKILMKDFGVSEVTAHKDIADAHKLFGSVQRVNREFKLLMYMNWQEQLASLCEAKGDPDGASKAVERATAILDKLRPDDAEMGGDKFYQLNLFFGKNDDILKRTIDFDKIEDLPASDFKEIIRAVDRPRVDEEMMEKLLLSSNEGD